MNAHHGCALLLAAALFAGCHGAPAAPELETRSPLVGQTFRSTSPHALTGTPVPPEVRAQLAGAQLEVMKTFGAIVADGESWQAAHRAVQAELRTPSPHPAWLREQAAANLMLNTFFAGEVTGRDAQEAVAFYTTLLLDRSSPEAATIARSLRQLDGHWPAARIAAAAEVAALDFERYLARAVDCRACASASSLLDGLDGELGERLSETQKAFLYTSGTALRDLHALRRP